MHKIFWPIAGVVVVAGAGLLAVVQSSIAFKPVLPRGVPRDISTADMAALENQWREEIRPSLRSESRAAVPETEHDFGMLDPGYPGSHTFAIRNEGTETLHLGDPQPDCDYIEGEFSQRAIAPGSTGEFVVRWQPVHIKSGTFRGTVKLPTSDPDHECISFRVHGEIIRRLTAIPGSLDFGDVDPREQPGPREAIIGSPVWESFEILEAKCEMARVTWQFEPATTAELAAHEFIGGYRISANMPEHLRQGRNVTYLQLKIQPPGEDSDPIDCQLRLGAKGLRRLCIYGDEIGRNAVIDLGKISPGTSKTAHLRVKIRDPLTELPGVRFEVEPSFVDVKLIDQQISDGRGGNYVLQITVPDDAPHCTHLIPQELGTLRILSDHPRIKEETLRLRFAVPPPKR